jgi:hypothetical protein
MSSMVLGDSTLESLTPHVNAPYVVEVASGGKEFTRNLQSD